MLLDSADAFSLLCSKGFTLVAGFEKFAKSPLEGQEGWDLSFRGGLILAQVMD